MTESPTTRNRLSPGEESAGDGSGRGGSVEAVDAVVGATVVTGADDVEVVPIGHSYGSVALGSALSQHDLDVDRAVAVGSPGLGRGIDGVEDLSVPRGGLYVGQNHDDVVAGLGQNGAFGLGGVLTPPPSRGPPDGRRR